MPSLLSRLLLGRKKTQDSSGEPGGPTSLLEGKFEAVSPTVSPSAAFFTDPGAEQIRGDDKPKDKESPSYPFRARSRPSSDLPTGEKSIPDVPHLSLNLPVTKVRGRALDVLFESDPVAYTLLQDTAIGDRRLTPHQALSLVRACSQVIIERGLETLGVMLPHWHSASSEVQHRLITLYLLSLASTSPDATASPTSPGAPSAFESKLHYTRSPHDVAAVLRWGLRHLKLDGVSFGKESGDWTWYNTFAEAERTNSYPPNAFSKHLIPQLPPIHAELLLATLDIISSLSAHGEANGSSGSKLSKFFGLWLLTSEHSTESHEWSAFYERWERAGRILEHLFLARIRDENHRMPRRLIELVEHYPYDTVTDAPNDSLLPRPRFSTRQYDALFVQMDTEYSGALKPKSHPLRLIADVLCTQSTPESATADDAGLWDLIKKASLALDTQECTSNPTLTEPTPIISNIFCDETIRLLSLIPLDASDKDNSASSFVLQSPISPSGSRPFSLLESPLKPIPTEHVRSSPSSGQALAVPGLTANSNTAPTTASPETPTDWLQFSNKGFGTMPSTRDLVAKLWDDDVEVTVPPTSPSRKSSRRARSRGSSVDSPSTQTPLPPPPVAPPPLVSKTTLISKVKLDEAFIDLWADSILDPISKLWQRFVLCQLKPLPSTVVSTTPTPTWLIIEQRFVHVPPAPLPKEEAEVTAPTSRPRASSPRPESSRLSAAFSLASKKRFGFFTTNSSDPKSPKEKAAPLPQVGEFGESVKSTGDGAVAAEVQKSKEARTQGGMNEGLASVATAVGTAAIAVATARATQEDIVPATTKDGLPVVVETVPSEPPTVTAPNTDVAVKDSHTPANMGQNGLASREEEQRKPEPEIAIQDPTDADGAMPATSEPVTTEVKPPVKEVEADMVQPELASASEADRLRLADDTGEGPIPQTEAPPTKLEPALTISAPEVPPLESAPIPEEPSIPEPIIEDAHTSQDSEPTHVVEDAPVETIPALVVEEFVVPAPEETTASQIPEFKPTVSVSNPSDLPVEAEAAAQEPVTETVAPGVEETHTLKELLTSTSTPIDALAAAEPIPVSEEFEAPQPEDNIATTLTGPVVVVVEDSPVTESVPAGDDGATPVYKDEAVASADAAEASALPEESSPPAVGLITEDDAQPASLPETHAIPEEPVEATIHESGTDSVPVTQSDVSCSPATPATPETLGAEPTVEPIEFTPPLDETRPSWQAPPQAQDDVIEERPTTEKVGPVVINKEPLSIADAEATPDLAEAPPDIIEPHQASADESTPAEVPATSHGDEVDTVIVEPTAAEHTPVAEPVLDASCNSGPLVDEFWESENENELVHATEPEATAPAHDSTPSHANGSAQLMEGHATTDELVTSTGQVLVADQPTEGSTLKAEVGIEQAITDKNLPTAEESATPPPAESTPVGEEPPAVSEMPTQTPAPPAAVEPDSTTGSAADTDVVAESPEEALTPVAVAPVELPTEEPALDDAEVASTAPVGTQIPLTEEPATASEMSIRTPSEAPEPDGHAPDLPGEAAAAATSQIPTEASVPVSEELTATATSATMQAQVPDTEGSPTEELVVPVAEEASPATENHSFGFEATVEEEPVVVEEEPAVVEEPTIVEEEPTDVVEEEEPNVVEEEPTEEKPTVVVDEEPAVEEEPADEEEPTDVVEKEPNIVEELEEPAEEKPTVVEEVPAVEEVPVVEEEPPVGEGPAIEQELPESEQVAQEPGAHPGEEAAAAVAPEPASMPDSENVTASETETLVDL